jgi:Na+-driven multidrug efflux pump
MLMTRAGVAIGGGWQALVAYINIGCYYVFGLPLGYLLGYRAKLGVEVCARSSSSKQIIRPCASTNS